MREGLLDRDAAVRVEGQHAVEQVQRARVRPGEQVHPWNARLERQRLQVAPRLLSDQGLVSGYLLPYWPLGGSDR